MKVAKLATVAKLTPINGTKTPVKGPATDTPSQETDREENPQIEPPNTQRPRHPAPKDLDTEPDSTDDLIEDLEPDKNPHIEPTTPYPFTPPPEDDPEPFIGGPQWVETATTTGGAMDLTFDDSSKQQIEKEQQGLNQAWLQTDSTKETKKETYSLTS